MSIDYYDHLGERGKFSVIKVPVGRISALWRYVLPFIDEALGIAPELRIDDIIDGLADESIQLWIVSDGYDIIASFLTSIERDREDWVLSLYALAGSGAKLWMSQCDDMMEAFARYEGAKRIRMCGRKAWQRLLPETFAITGVRQGHNVYERPIT